MTQESTPHLPGARVVVSVVRTAIALGLRVFSDFGDGAQRRAAHWARHLPAWIWRTGPVVRVRLRGVRYQLDLRDNVQRTLYFTGWYERRYLSILLHRLRSDDVFVDVGAHIGIHSLAAARQLRRLGGGKVIAFEPATDTSNALLSNLALNDMQDVEVVKVALGASLGEESLKSDPIRFDPDDVAVRSFFGPGEISESVTVVSFDSWADTRGLQKMDVVKIDVEGAEMAVLEGMKRSIGRFRPRLIGVEIRAYLLGQAGVLEQELRGWLESAGYTQLRLGDLEGNYIFEKTMPLP